MKMNRTRTIWLTAIILHAFVSTAGLTQQAIAKDRPNVVVILTDDQGWGDLSFHGNTNLSTPRIDSLAEDGARFDRFHVCPVCSPTRAEFLTGRYHPRGNVWGVSTGGERLNLDERTIADVFKDAGYKTAAFGKWHNGMQYPYHPNGRGFDEFYGFCSGHWGHYFSPMLDHNGKIVRGEGYLTDDFTSRAIQFIEANRDKPFFVYLPYNTPHSPMQAPDRWWKKFEDFQPKMRHRDPEKERIDHLRAALAMCENIDWNVGRVLDKLDELNLADNTIVVFFHDNGPNGARWNNGMKGRKGSTDEGGVRSPLFVRWPGKIKKGKSIEPIAGAIDLLPTLAGLADIEVNATKPLDGVSFAPLLHGVEMKWKDRFIFSRAGDRAVVRSQRFLLDRDGRLFDLIADPGQRTNIAGKHPDVVGSMKKAGDVWRADVMKHFGRANDDRPFTVGPAGFAYTQLPARDAKTQGGLKRSSRHPNCSYFFNWKTKEDAITWDVEVLAAGKFKVEMYYCCKKDDVGATVEMRLGDQAVWAKIVEANDPPVVGAAEDRSARTESLVRDFKALDMGVIELKPGRGTLTLRAVDIPGAEVGEFRLLMLTRQP